MKTEKQIMIVEKAKGVFLANGFFSTVMDDIAMAAGLTRRTLYRHFKTKEDIAYEVMMLVMKDWNVYNQSIYEEVKGNGIEKLSDFFNRLIDYMEERRLFMKFIGEFDYYFKDDVLEKHMRVETDDFDTTMRESDNLIRNIIQEGIVDGSIKATIDIPLMEATISNVLWSFGQRVAIRGKAMKIETGYSGVQLIRHQVKIIIMAIEENGKC